jgi:hypothetical protein
MNTDVLNCSLAGNIRVFVGSKQHEQWYNVHTPLERILLEALNAPPLSGFGLSPQTARILRVETDTGLVEVAVPE